MKKLLVLILLFWTAASGRSPRRPVTVFKGAELIDGTGALPIKKSVLVIEGDRITAVGKEGKVHYPKGARVIDLEGRTIMPGIINAHGHVGLVSGTQVSATAYTRENIGNALAQYEQYGVTSMLSLGLNRDLIYTLRDEQHQGTFPGASIFTAGRGFGVEGGAPPLEVAPDQVYRPRSADEARAQVREIAAHHPDIIKLWLDDVFGKYPKMDPAVYKAIIDESHKQGLRVAAHVFYLADAKALVADGVDVFAHSVRDLPVDDELIAAMKSRGVIYTPSLMVDESYFVFAETPAVMQDLFFKQAVSLDVAQTAGKPAISQQSRERSESRAGESGVRNRPEEFENAERCRRSNRFGDRLRCGADAHSRLGGTSRARTDGSLGPHADAGNRSGHARQRGGDRRIRSRHARGWKTG